MPSFRLNTLLALAALLGALLTTPAFSQTEPAPQAAEDLAEASAPSDTPLLLVPTVQKPPILTQKSAVILGLVEGISEFLPISSTGHLIIANAVLGLESEERLTDAQGNPLYHKKPSEKHPAGVPLTTKLAADTYTVIIQVGAIAAVMLLYWNQLVGILKGLLGRNPEGLLLLRNLACAIVPVAIIGLALSSWIDENLFSVPAVIVAQLSGAILMIYAERWRRERSSLRVSNKAPTELSVVESAGIGFMQCLALWPGTSRSMVTIVGGYFMNLNPAKAAEFSFLVGLPVLAGAALIKGLKSGSAMITVFGWSNVLLGIAVAAVSAAIAVKFLVAFLSRYGLFAFAFYRIAFAVILTVWFYT